MVAVINVNNPVINWFGESFTQLHPQLQELHNNGGQLNGIVTLSLATGLTGIIAKRLAVKMGLPKQSGAYDFQVLIFHENGQLHWNRQFNNQQEMKSVFIPHGHYPLGYWQEKTGGIELELGVDIKQGGWYWRQRKVRLWGISMPSMLFPSSIAYKTVENSQYVFSVAIKLPLFGELLHYNGALKMDSNYE